MTPKEKAEELMKKFKPYMYCYMGSGMLSNDYNEEVSLKYAKQCALIAVDEIISNTPYGFYSGIIPAYKGTDLDYWQEVKQEIEEL